MDATSTHLPVLVDELAALAAGRACVVDATAGRGGHVARFLEAGARVLAIDRDPAAAAALRARWPTAPLEVREASFADPDTVAAVKAFRPDFILMDLGVSSQQLDDDARGFTFRPGATLDMRMSGSGETAAAGLNRWSVAELTRVFREYGDVPGAGRLARVVVQRRERHPFRTSDDLVNAVRAAGGPRTGPADFARVFQAVRIAVNDELEALAVALPAFRDALGPGGMLAVIAYHSGEDRIVKHVFRDWARACVCPREHPVCTCRGRPLGRVVTRKPVTAGPEEVAANPRARSARLRVFEVSA